MTIASYLCSLFINCFKRGVFPDCLEVAEILPVHKIRDGSEATYYRPIPLFFQLVKMFRKECLEKNMSACKIIWIKNCLLSKYQSGFCESSSSIPAVTVFPRK